jgi:hypothetical protein
VRVDVSVFAAFSARSTHAPEAASDTGVATLSAGLDFAAANVVTLDVLQLLIGRSKDDAP